MARRKWYKRILAIALTALLMLNGSETGLSALADILSDSAHTQTYGESTDEISGETEDKPIATSTFLKRNNDVDPPKQQSAGGGAKQMRTKLMRMMSRTRYLWQVRHTSISQYILRRI